MVRAADVRKGLLAHGSRLSLHVLDHRDDGRHRDRHHGKVIRVARRGNRYVRHGALSNLRHFSYAYGLFRWQARQSINNCNHIRIDHSLRLRALLADANLQPMHSQCVSMDIFRIWSYSLLCITIWVRLIPGSGTPNGNSIRFHNMFPEHRHFLHTARDKLHPRQHDQCEQWLLLDLHFIHRAELLLRRHQDLAPEMGRPWTRWHPPKQITTGRFLSVSKKKTRNARWVQLVITAPTIIIF